MHSAFAEEFYYPKTDIFFISSGIYYDDPGKINSLLSKSFETTKLPAQVYYFGIGYKINHNPIISNKPYFLLYSIEAKFPLSRRTNNIYYNAELQTYILSLDVSTFESYVKTVTVHPIIGFAFSKTDLILPLKYDDSDKRFYTDKFTQKFEKFSASLNIGGGADLRIRLREFEQETKNLLLTFNAKYSICLDKLNFYDKKWTNNSIIPEELSDYSGPGLAIELNISIENQRK